MVRIRLTFAAGIRTGAKKRPPKGKNFRVPEKPVASPVNGLPRQKY